MVAEVESSVLYEDNQTKVKILRLNQELKSTQSTGWSFYLAAVGICTTLGSSIPVGYNIGVINSPASFIKDWCILIFDERFSIALDITTLDILWSTIVSIFLVGGAVGSLGGAWAADKFGRKGSFLICGGLFVLGSILFFFCRAVKSIEMLFLGRFLVGLASGLCTTSLPMYLTEIAPIKLRGALGTFCAIGVTGGVVVGQIFSLKYTFGSEEYWHYALSAYLLFVVVGYLPSFYFPESPKYLYLIKKQREQAKKELYKLRHNSVVVDSELEEMERSLQQQTHKDSIMRTLRNSRLTLPLIIVCAFMGGQQLSGINAIFYYSVSIFEKTGLSHNNAEWANLGAGCINLCTSLLGPYLMKNYNRRTLMMFSCGIDAIILFFIGLIINFINDVSWFPVTCIVAIFLYIFFYQFGLGPIPYFIGAELFETESRPVAMAMGSLSSWVCNFIIGMTFPSLQAAWGAYVFLPFSLTCLCLFVLTKYFLPETRGRDSSEVAELVSKGFKSKIGK